MPSTNGGLELRFTVAALVASFLAFQAGKGGVLAGQVDTCVKQAGCIAVSFSPCLFGVTTVCMTFVDGPGCLKDAGEGISSVCAGCSEPEPQCKASPLGPGGPSLICQSITPSQTIVAFFAVKDGASDACLSPSAPGPLEEVTTVNSVTAFCGDEDSTGDGYNCVPGQAECEWKIVVPPCSVLGGDPHFSGFDGTQYDVKEKDGFIYNILTEEQHTINARFAQVPPVMVENAWMTEFGLVLYNTTVTVRLNLKNYTAVFNNIWEDPGHTTRMLYTDLATIISVTVDGEDTSNLLESGRLVSEAGGAVTVYFPKDKHVHDPTDGPVVVVGTPKLEVHIVLETEGVLHLDMAMRLKSNKPLDMHGLVGQTIHWDANIGNNHIEGAEDDYIVPALLDKSYTFTRFGQPRAGRQLRDYLKLAEKPKAGSRQVMKLWMG